jgi:RimJ/RimL family protein N-acetyltransferase
MNTEQRGTPPIDIPQQPIEIISPEGNITLRQFAPSDADEIFALIDSGREHLSQHGDETAAKYQTVDAVRESIVRPSNPARLRFGIRNRDGVLVGSINVTPEQEYSQIGEIGYYLGVAHTGQGYTTTAVEALTRYAFDELGYEQLYGKVAEANTPSVKVLQRAGYEETKREDGEIYLTRRK